MSPPTDTKQLEPVHALTLTTSIPPTPPHRLFLGLHTEVDESTDNFHIDTVAVSFDNFNHLANHRRVCRRSR
jgi:stress-induced morphogen